MSATKLGQRFFVSPPHFLGKGVLFYLFVFLACLGCGQLGDGLRGRGKLPTLSTGVDLNPFQGIVGGVSDDTSGASKSTVALVGMGRFGLVVCAGAIVSDTLILTAEHCLDQGVDRVVFGPSLRKPERVTPIVQEWSVKERPHEDFFPNFDVAWVKFEGGLPPGYEPAPILEDPAALTPGLPLIVIGYGNTAENPGEGSSGERLVASSVLGAYHDNEEFHGILEAGPVPTGGPCWGDSGGPAFADLGTGKLHIVGVFSGTDSRLIPVENCDNGHVLYNFPGQFKAQIEATTGLHLP